MADADVLISAGSGTKIDTRTVGAGTDEHRQVMVVGDPTTAANVATVTAAGAQNVTGLDLASSAISIAANATSGGSITTLSGHSAAIIQLTGTFVATCQVQVTADGSTWVNVTGSTAVLNAATGAWLASGNMTAVGVYQVDIAGYAGVRIITTAYTSGTVNGIVRASAGTGIVAIEGSLPAGTAIIGALSANQSTNIAQMNGVATTMGNGVAGTGVQRVAIASDNTAFNVLTTGATPTSTSVNSAATTNATSTKASAGTLYSIVVNNNNAALRYLKLYNKASAPTVGTDIPFLTIPIPIGGVQALEFGPQGIRFSTGIAWALTGLGTDADATAVAAAEHKVTLTYI